MNSYLGPILKILCCYAISWTIYHVVSPVSFDAAIIILLSTLFLWAHLFARDILNFFIAIKHKAERDALSSWSGRYYEFDGHHIRFYFHEEKIWIPLRDLKSLVKPEIGERELRLLGADYFLLPEINAWAISEIGVEKLLTTRTEHRRADYQMIRLKRWLTQQALPNVRRLPRSSVTGSH